VSTGRVGDSVGGMVQIAVSFRRSGISTDMTTHVFREMGLVACPLGVRKRHDEHVAALYGEIISHVTKLNCASVDR
jgi:hypothetical protein